MNRTLHFLRAGQAPVTLPASRLLSNGRLRSVITAAGEGGLWFDWMALNVWDSAHPVIAPGWALWWRDAAEGGAPRRFADGEPVPFGAGEGAGACRLLRRFEQTELLVEALVAPNAHAELRRVTVRNLGRRERAIELTVAREVALHHPLGHAAHPAFSKLFVQTEYDGQRVALLVRRRPRSATESWPWLVHTMTGPGALQFETDRARFLGRGRRNAIPAAMASRDALSGTVGNVLDPVLATRRVLMVPAGGSAAVVTLLGVGGTREEALALLSSPAAFEQAESEAARELQARCARLALSLNDGFDFEALAVAILTGDRQLRANEQVLLAATGRPPAGVLESSGPYLVVLSKDPARDPAVTHLSTAQEYWRALGLNAALVLLAPGLAMHGQPGEARIHRPLESLSSAELTNLLAGADFVAGDASESWAQRRERETADLSPAAAAAPPAFAKAASGQASLPPGETLWFDNGYGGFSADGREYVIRIHAGEDRAVLPPQPWVNVLANPSFGCVLSEAGAGSTWARNSREHRVTPWSNDPVLDWHGEALYLRDEASGEAWSPLPGARPAVGAYEVRHGFGYTRFLHYSHDLRQETTVFVPLEDSLKITRVELTNQGDTAKRVSLFAFQELVLGPPGGNARLIATQAQAGTHALLARNPLAGEFADGIAFVGGVADLPHEWRCCGDRRAFLGSGLDPEHPRLPLSAENLNGRTGAGWDPCFAQQITVEIPPSQSCSLILLLGEVTSEAGASHLVQRYSLLAEVERALADVREFWRDLLGTLQVETPSKALDFMLNGWLVYQSLACRMWGRTGFYQSSGAYGFRDQLQDSSAFLALRPAITRQQILLHAAQQFVEGDVLHWWHPPPIERGVRTRFSDDRNWLPLVVAEYVAATGDEGLLDEQVPFLTARGLEPGEDEAFLQPALSGETGSVYEHCCRALDRSLPVGAHGLPLMGTGDWNDGMNRVGREGRGESVWMGFFLCHILGEFAPICARRGDEIRARRYAEHREALGSALQTAGWDGEWYLRAFYDDGTLLGSAQSDECRIDALVQAWAIMSGMATGERAEQILDAVERHLVSDQDQIIRLLTPPFVETPHDPGYIKGYVAGVRENGGQYTHAACWVVRAFAEAGRHDRAAQLLEMLMPVAHAATGDLADTFRLEPYVVAADIYGAPPHIGRGGWNWYTGSAAWLYRVAIETVLGFRIENGDTLVLTPRLPSAWLGCRLVYRFPASAGRTTITVRNQGGSTIVAAVLDGAPLAVTGSEARVPIPEDGFDHEVEITTASE